MMHPLRSLRYPNYRLFFAGQFVSLLGTWLQTVATIWLVYRLSGSPLLLGLTTGIQQLPLLFLSPVAGVWSDRHDRRKVLMVTQALGTIQALLLAGLTFTGMIEVPHVMALALLLGLINALETPTRQAFVLEMIGDKHDLPNAIALNSMLFNSARFVGPALAGIVLAAFGEAWCFTLNALSFVATFCAYKRMRIVAKQAVPGTSHWLSDLGEGMRYAFGFVGIRRLLLLLAVLSICSTPWQPLMPVFASDVYGGDSRTLGWLIGAVGIGALVGTGYLMLRPGLRGLGRVIPITAMTSGLGMAVFACSEALWLGLPMLAVFGFGLIATVASCNTLVQTIAEEHMRGRVIGLYVVAFLGMSPIGHFLSGALAERIGVQWTLFLCGASMVIAAACFAYTLPSWREAVRRARASQDAVTQLPGA